MIPRWDFSHIYPEYPARHVKPVRTPTANADLRQLDYKTIQAEH